MSKISVLREGMPETDNVQDYCVERKNAMKLIMSKISVLREGILETDNVKD